MQTTTVVISPTYTKKLPVSMSFKNCTLSKLCYIRSDILCAYLRIEWSRFLQVCFTYTRPTSTHGCSRHQVKSIDLIATYVFSVPWWRVSFACLETLLASSGCPMLQSEVLAACIVEATWVSTLQPMMLIFLASWSLINQRLSAAVNIALRKLTT